MCEIDHNDMTLAVQVALNPSTTNQPTREVPAEGNGVCRNKGAHRL